MQKAGRRRIPASRGPGWQQKAPQAQHSDGHPDDSGREARRRDHGARFASDGRSFRISRRSRDAPERRFRSGFHRSIKEPPNKPPRLYQGAEAAVRAPARGKRRGAGRGFTGLGRAEASDGRQAPASTRPPGASPTGAATQSAPWTLIEGRRPQGESGCARFRRCGGGVARLCPVRTGTGRRSRAPRPVRGAQTGPSKSWTMTRCCASSR